MNTLIDFKKLVNVMVSRTTFEIFGINLFLSEKFKIKGLLLEGRSENQARSFIISTRFGRAG